jgi:hypothetical protein
MHPSRGQSFSPVRLFLDHPRAVGEGYRDHMKFAANFGAQMICGGLGCLIHAVFPFLFVTTGSRTVRNLHQLLATCPHRSVLQDGRALADRLTDQAVGKLPSDYADQATPSH